MNCTRARQVMCAQLDQELDAATSLEFTEHCAQCASCARSHAGYAALNQRIRGSIERHAAPDRLRLCVASMVNGTMPHTPMRSPRAGNRCLTWMRAIALCVIVATTAGIVGFLFGRSGTSVAPYDDVVALHVASLADRVPKVQVESADRHVIKPWLMGKADFAPPVFDLSDRGYALIGARFEKVDARPSVAVIYRVRNHYISHFVRRAETSGNDEPSIANARGFAVAAWREGGLQHIAISDIDPKELSSFIALLRPPAHR